MRCNAASPIYLDNAELCIREAGHPDQHSSTDYQWETSSQQPDRAAQIAEIQARSAIAEELSSVGFTREELTAATADQLKVAPSKDEILAVIWSANVEDEAQVKIRAAVEKLFADRGL